MRRLICYAASFLFIALLFSAYQAFAEVRIEKPDLPQGYEQWPETFSGSCAILDNMTIADAIFGRIDHERKTGEVVLTQKINDDVHFILYVRWTKSNLPTWEEELMNIYLPSGNGWLKFDYKNGDDAALAEKSADKRADEKGINLQLFLKNCPSLSEKTDGFFSDFHKKLNPKE